LAGGFVAFEGEFAVWVPGAAEELEFGGFIGLIGGRHLLGWFGGRGGGRVEGEVALGAAGEDCYGDE
jgi:hypothetical protein